MAENVVELVNTEQQSDTGKKWFLSKSTIAGMKSLAESVCGQDPKSNKSYEQCVEELKAYYISSDKDGTLGEPSEELIQFILAAGLGW